MVARCVYEPDAPTWQDLWVIRLDPIGLAASKPFPRAIEELWRCFSTHPVLYLSHEYFYDKVSGCICHGRLKIVYLVVVQ